MKRTTSTGLPPGFSLLLFAGVMASELLAGRLARHAPGGTSSRRRRGRSTHALSGQLVRLLEQAVRGDLSAWPSSSGSVASGRLFGMRDLLAEAAAELAAVRVEQRCRRCCSWARFTSGCDPFATGS